MDPYIHIEFDYVQSAKHPGQPCGDVVVCQRNIVGTTLVCGDGIGSGVHAHLVAEMGVRRLLELFRLGFSLHKAVGNVARSMDQYRDPRRAYVAFTVTRVRTDGTATLLSYQSPDAFMITQNHVHQLESRTVRIGETLVNEANYRLRVGDGLLVVSDGITQAGLGSVFPLGWQANGIARFANDCLDAGVPIGDLPDRIHGNALHLWERGGDDCTVALLRCRSGRVVNILTGPPTRRDHDTKIVRDFLDRPGAKIVCGGTTAEIVARVLGKKACLESNPKSLIAPPRMEIPGIDLVTEGAVTLNQTYNIFDEDCAGFEEDSSVTELCTYLQKADRINIFQGCANNQSNKSIHFRQRGILSRGRIIPLLAEKLRRVGKLVVVLKESEEEMISRVT